MRPFAKALLAITVALIGAGLAHHLLTWNEGVHPVQPQVREWIELPPPTDMDMPLKEALKKRRSIRKYLPEPIRINQLANILWAAQGITHGHGFRTAPSAGALYPIRVYVVIKKRGVDGLPAGVYVYDPHRHALGLVRIGDVSTPLMRACLGQEWVGEAPVDIILVGYESVLRPRYGERSFRYMAEEAGHIGQNIYLACTAMGLGTVAVGAFHDDEVKKILGITAPDAAPLYVFPVGVPAER